MKKIKFDILTESELIEYGVFSSVDETYDFIKSNPENQRGKNSIQWIYLYMDELYQLAKECNHITEMGVNEVNSSWAFLKARPKKLVCIDITFSYAYKRVNFEDHIWLESLKALSKKENVDLTLIEDDTTKIEIEETDLLFIDTKHTYQHLKKELNLHANKVKKYIAFHDTVLFPELNNAIIEFLETNRNWTIYKNIKTNPGLLIIKNNT
jgi:hypothetical protein